LSGTIAGSFTFSGVPIFSGLSPGTCANALGLDSGNHLIEFSCSGGGGGITSLSQGPGMSFSVNPIVTSGTISLAVPVSAANGGTGVASPTLYGTLVGQGAAAVHSVAPSTSGFVLTSNGGAADPSFQAPTGGTSFANPTATIGTAAVNGSATTAMRSDAAPAIPQCSASTFGACKVDGSTITAAAGVITAVGGTANNTIPVFPTAGGPTTYTATAAGYTAASSTLVCVAFTTTNVANPTLNIQGAGAKPIKILSSAALLSPAGGEIPTGGATCLDYDGTNYVMVTYPAPGPPITATDTVTAQKWSSGQVYNILTASQTITLPAAGATLPTGGSITISTGDVTAQLCAVGSDVINNAQIGGGSAGGCIIIPADTVTLVSTSGTAGATAFSAPLGPIQYFPFSWGVGMDLSLNTGGNDFGRYASPRIVYGVKCKNNTLAGGTQTMTFKYQTDAGGTMAAGTTISSAPFDMNANLGVEQTVTLTSSPLLVPAAYSVGSTVSGSATAGSGRCQYTYR
jgi:hypothetical protein